MTRTSLLVTAVAGIGLAIGLLAALVMAGPAPLPPVYQAPTPLPYPTPAVFDPTSLVGEMTDLALTNARDEAAKAVATGRAQDRATAAAEEPTREAALVDRAVRAAQLTMVPTARPGPTNTPTLPPCDAIEAGLCAKRPTPTATAPLCVDGATYQGGAYICRKVQTATASPVPTETRGGPH